MWVTAFAAGEGMDRGMCGCILFYCDKFCSWGRNGQGYMCGCITFHCDKFCSWGRNRQGYVWVYHISL